MSAPTEKQGYLGDLSQKSSEELRDLLRRQEQIAANSKFMNRLPDKGAKIHEKIAVIERVLEQKAEIDSTADLFHNMAIRSERSRTQRGDMAEDEEEERLLRRLANRNEENKVVKTEESAEPESMDPEVPFVNSYEKVIKKAEQRKQPKQKFMPNRSIKTKHIQDLSAQMETLAVKKDVVSLEKASEDITDPENTNRLKEIKPDASTDNKISHASPLRNDGLSKESSSSSQSPAGHGRLKHKYDELLEEKLYTGQSHCTQAKTLSIEESFELQDQQKKRAEELLAKQAAGKLAEKLNVKMSEFNPEGSSSFNRYRTTEQTDDDPDSDDEDPGVLEYPD